MKKLFLSFAVLAGFCVITNAQTTTTTTVSNPNPGGVWLKGGVNFSNISVNSNGTVNNSNALTTFNVGFIGDVPLADMLSFQSGIYLNGKGSKAQSSTYNVTFNPLYLEVPANFVIKLPVDNNSRFFVGAGPYLAMGIGGKTKGNSTIAGISSSYEKNIQFSDNGPNSSAEQDASVNQLRRFDYGVNFLAGIEVHSLMIGVGYQLGLAKIGATQNDTNDKNKYRIFSVNLGVKL